MIKFAWVNEGESKRKKNQKLTKMFGGKNLQMTQKIFTHWFDQKRPDGVKNRCMRCY